MPAVFPFSALQYATGRDVSRLIAPPYDVLDARAKAALLTPPAGDPRNIVAIDLPQVPPEGLGPTSVYQAAAGALEDLLRERTIRPSDAPVMFAYRQTFASDDGTRMVQRCGMACCVETVPFGARPGGGILPHEETFSGPKEDRLALMTATRTQLSPIFGLHPDEQGRANALLQQIMASRRPDQIGTTGDHTLHEVWTVRGRAELAAYEDALAGEDVFVADGHHRYNTALTYLSRLEAEAPVGPDHPARRCMFVLVSMRDPGLVIWPTHRVLGGMSGYSFEAFKAAARDHVLITPVNGGLDALRTEMVSVTVPPPPLPHTVLGFYDFGTRRSYVGTLKTAAPLAGRFPEKPRAWQQLDVAIVQHLIVEQICQPMLNRGKPVRWAFPHTVGEVEEIGRGAVSGTGEADGWAQLAIVVRPTPLAAVREVSRAGQLMPQKSTYFYPKLATGLFMHALG